MLGLHLIFKSSYYKINNLKLLAKWKIVIFWYRGIWIFRVWPRTNTHRFNSYLPRKPRSVGCPLEISCFGATSYYGLDALADDNERQNTLAFTFSASNSTSKGEGTSLLFLSAFRRQCPNRDSDR